MLAEPMEVVDSPSLNLVHSLHTATSEMVVQVLGRRTRREFVYTPLGELLLAVNPYCQLVAEPPAGAGSGSSSSESPLRILLDRIHRRVTGGLEQSALLLPMGESGSGKTVTTILSLDYLLSASPASAGLQARLESALAIMHAFGNSRTTRNDNASRFILLLQLQLDFRGIPRSATLNTYLLDKWSLPTLHIFPSLLRHADANLLKTLQLSRNVERYEMLKDCAAELLRNDGDGGGTGGGGGGGGHAGMDIKDHLALLNLDFLAIFRLLAAILKLGSTRFIPTTEIDGTEGCQVHPESELASSATLLGLANPSSLSRAFTHTQKTCLGAGLASQRRDAFCRALYSRLFVYVSGKVGKAVNSCAAATTTTTATTSNNGASATTRSCYSSSTISFLDSPGFQLFPRNGFSQLVINLAAERLEAALVDSRLKQMQEDYVKDGISWVTVDTRAESTRRCELVQGSEFLLELPHCFNPVTPSAAASTTPRSPAASRSSSRHHGGLVCSDFRIAHFGGSVQYDSSDFEQKNMENVSLELARLVANAEHPFLAELFPEGIAFQLAPSASGNNSNNSSATVSPPPPLPSLSQLQLSITQILALVQHDSPYFIRCIKPNELSLPRLFEPALVLHQVKCGRLMDFLRVYKEGFGYSLPVPKFLKRYKLLSLRTWPNCPTSPESAVVILRDLGLGATRWRVGRALVFLKDSNVVDELEELREERLEDLAVLVQKTWRGWRVYKNVRRRLKCGQQRRRRSRAAGGGGGAELGEEFDEAARREAMGRIERCYIRWKRRDFLLTLASDLPSISPVSRGWPHVSPTLAEPSQLIYKLFHRWRCAHYRASYASELNRRRMREKVTASVLFKGRKVSSYSKSVSHPFIGDYVRLRQNPDWKLSEHLVFADLVHKISRSGGKLLPCLLAVTTSSFFLLDQRSLSPKERVDLRDLIGISVSPFHDEVVVFHVQPPSQGSSGAAAAFTSPPPSCSGASAELFKGDLVVQCSHLIELVTKVVLCVGNLTKAPPVRVEERFHCQFGSSSSGQQVEVTFKVTSGHHGHAGSSGASGAPLRVSRRAGRLDFTI